MPTANAWPERLLKKSGRCGIAAGQGVALYLWLIVVISVRQSTVAAISGLRCWTGYGQFEHKADNLIANSSGRNGQRRLMYEQSHRDYLHLVICIIVTCAGLLIITVITPLPTNPARQKCQRTEAGERGNYWHADASAWCLLRSCKIRKELADAKAENDALRDDVAAGRRRLPASKQSVSQCVKPPPPRRG